MWQAAEFRRLCSSRSHSSHSSMPHRYMSSVLDHASGKTSSDVTSSPSSMDFSIGLAPSRSDVLIDDSSLPTMDSDYNQHAPGACSLSDAGGTLGSQSQALTNFSTGQHTFGSPFGVGSAAGDSVEKRMYQHHVYHSYSPSKMNAATQREEMLEITAPAGKLGVVIDTPSLSAVPIVHAIKGTQLYQFWNGDARFLTQTKTRVRSGMI